LKQKKNKNKNKNKNTQPQKFFSIYCEAKANAYRKSEKSDGTTTRKVKR